VAEAERAAADGAVAFKSVIAYRTGLDVGDPTRAEARAAYGRWRDDAWRETRADAKPVRDLLLRRALDVAAAAGGVPVHVHCGGGDPSIVLGHARPQDLFPLLAERLTQRWC
jgi:nucleotide-binding universal stress UspA family protein